MFEKILVPVDGSATSRKGLDAAIALARLSGGRIRVLHAFEPPLLAIGTEFALMRGEDIHNVARADGQRCLSEAASSVRAAGLPVEEQLVECDGKRLSDIVIENTKAWQASVIVLGSHGRRGFRRMLLGSDAEQILRTSGVPVMLVRDPESGDT